VEVSSKHILVMELKLKGRFLTQLQTQGLGFMALQNSDL